MSEPRRVDFPVPADATIGMCRSCGAPIVWVVTAAGRRMPLSLASAIDTPDGPRAISHFADCPDADRYRKDR